MRLAAVEWILSTWREHWCVGSAVYGGLIAAFKLPKGPEFDLSPYVTLGSERAVWSSLTRDTGFKDKMRARITIIGSFLGCGPSGQRRSTSHLVLG